MESKLACQTSLLQQQQEQQQQQFSQRILNHLAFNSDVLDRWHQIGSAQGLSTDLEVATFLIQHYENTWDRAQPTDFCLTCHNPLALSCVKCTATPHPPTTTSHHNNNTMPPAAATTNAFSTLFEPGENFTVEPLSTRPALDGKKRSRKGKGGKPEEGAVANSIENDEDLMGLYIQFAQPSSGIDAHSVILPASSNKLSRLKTYVCIHCGKSFFKPSDFKKHVRIHTREKPYKCAHCPAAFSDSSSASRHRRVHTGEKPFCCKLCPSSFAQSSDLTKHMRIHTRERPWQCTRCDQTFADTSSYARHRRKHDKAERKQKKMVNASTMAASS